MNLVIGLATAFNGSFITERVEVRTSGTMLLSLCCELGQGIAIARAMPTDQVAHMLSKRQAPVTWATPVI